MSRDGSALRPLPIAADVVGLGALWATSIAIAHSALLAESPELVAPAILFDLTLTAALCHALVGVRLGRLPAWTVLPVVAAGLALGRAILPDGLAGAGYLALVLVAAVEVALLGVAAGRVRQLARTFRAARQAGSDRFDALEQVVRTLVPFAPRVAAFVRLEFEVWFLLLAGWRLRPGGDGGERVFSHHRECGWLMLAGVLVFLVIVEGAVVHVLLARAGYVLVTWVMLALQAYGLVWIAADVQALRVRPTVLRAGALDVRIGLRARARVPLADIADVELGSWPTTGPDEVALSVTGPANVRITLRQPVEVKRALRPSIRAHVLLVQVDEREMFRRAALRAALGQR
jgi:hypothetical protein